MTEAVIWRKIAAISAWISASVLSVEAAAGAALFSWSVVEAVFEDFDVLVGWKIWT